MYSIVYLSNENALNFVLYLILSPYENKVYEISFDYI